METKYLIFCTGLFIRAAVLFAHAHILGCDIDRFAFPFSFCDCLGGVGLVADVGGVNFVLVRVHGYDWKKIVLMQG